MAPVTRLRYLVPRCNRPYLTDTEIRIGYLWMPVYWLIGCAAVWLLDGSWWVWATLVCVALGMGVGMGLWLNSRARPRKFRDRLWKETG